MDINKTLLAKLITEKCGTPKAVAEIAAEEMIRDDFPNNGIKTPGQAIAYLDRLRSLLPSTKDSCRVPAEGET